MKKLLAFLMLSVILLAGCGEPAPEEETTKAEAFNLHLIGVSEYDTWFENIENNSANAESLYTFHKVDSVFDQTDLIKEIIKDKKDNYVNGILLGFGPEDYVGGSQEAAEENFNLRKAYIEELSQITMPADFVLFVANGFPKLEEETDEYLLWNYEATRAYLEEKFYDTNEMIVNFSIVRSLSYDSDYLRTEYLDENNELNQMAFNQLDSDLAMYLGLISKRRNEAQEAEE